METTKGSGTEWPSGWRGKILLFVGKTMPVQILKITPMDLGTSGGKRLGGRI